MPHKQRCERAHSVTIKHLTTAVKLITTKDYSQLEETSDCCWLTTRSWCRRGRVRCGDDLRDVLLQRVQDDDGLFDLVHVEIVDALHLLVKDRGERSTRTRSAPPASETNALIACFRRLYCSTEPSHCGIREETLALISLPNFILG